MRKVIEQDSRISERKEPDWDFLDYVDRIEEQWKEDLRLQLPKTESEWLEIFPEARKVLRNKIREWEEVAACAHKAVSKALREIEAKPVKHQWFWRAVLKHISPAVKDLAIANRHIKRLNWLRPSSKKKYPKLHWQNSLERARSANLVDIAKLYGLRLRKSGRTYQALCPFHTERTASFHIYPPSRFVCFGCGVKGDVIAFVQKIAGLSFKESVYKLQNL